MSPRPPLPRKVGGHDPPAPMGAPPLRGGPAGGKMLGFSIDLRVALTTLSHYRAIELW